MNDEASFGVRLTANIKEYKTKMNEVQTIAKTTSETVKNNISNMTDIASLDKGINAINSKLQKMREAMDKTFVNDKGVRINQQNISATDEQLNLYDRYVDTLKKLENRKNQLQIQQFNEIAKAKEAAEALNSQAQAYRETQKEMYGYSGALKLVKKDQQESANETKEASNKIKEAIIKIKQTASNTKKTGNILSGIADSIKKQANSIKKSFNMIALATLGVRSAYFGLRKAVSSYLSYDTKLSQQLSNTWSALGAQLAPIIEFVINLFSKAIAYINAFVTALTGINMVAKANAKALNKQSSAAANANKSLAGFDELTNINQDSGAGGAGAEAGAGMIELPEVDASKLMLVLEKIKKLASELFQPIQGAWNTYGSGVISSAENMLKSLWETIKSIGGSFKEVWMNGTGEEIIGNILEGATLINDIIAGISDAFRNAWENAGSGTNIIQGIADIIKMIQEFVNSVMKSLKEWVLSESFQTALEYVVKVIEQIIENVKFVGKEWLNIYNEYLKPVVENILGLITDVISLIAKIWTVFQPIAREIWKIVMNSLKPVIELVVNSIQTIINKIRDVVNIITGVLEGNWKKVFNSMKALARDSINGIIGFFNAWISGLNLMLTPLRKIIVAIAKAFGSSVTLGDIKIPSIPKLEVGTNYVPEDQLAYIHKGEAVIPKKFNSSEYFGSSSESNEETNELLRTLIDTLDNKEFSSYIKVDDIGKASVKYINDRSRSTGKSVIEV